MQVTLRKARQIEKLLKKSFNRDVETSGEFSVHRDTDFLRDEMNGYFSDFADNLQDLIDINDAIFEIRELIHVKNETFGLNALIASRAKVVDILNRMQQFAFCETTLSDVVLKSKIETAKKSLGQNAYGSSNDTIEISKCTEEQLQSIESGIAEYKQRVVSLDDLILTNNLNTKIKLSEKILDLLKKLKIPH